MVINTLSDIINEFLKLQNKILNILNSINESMISNNETITFTYELDNGEKITYSIPSFNYLNEKILNLENTLKNILNLENNSIIKTSDGLYKKVINLTYDNPNDILYLTIPNTFGSKVNTLIEKLLSPQPHITIDLSKYASKNDKKVLYKKIVIIPSNLSEEEIFNKNFNGKNNLIYEEVINILNKFNISYYEYEDYIEFINSKLNYYGEFLLLNILDEKNVYNDGTIKYKRKYLLNNLEYKDLNNNSILKLKIGDKLIFNNTIFEIEDIDFQTNKISLKRIIGYDTLSIGSKLKFYSEIKENKSIDIPIKYDERCILFFKFVNSDGIESINWSPGIGFFTNDLKIKISNSDITLKDFYLTYITDFKNILLSFAKERIIPAIYGETPDYPLLNKDNFKVLQINTHLIDENKKEEIKKKYQEKIKLQDEIKQLEESIIKNKELLFSDLIVSEEDRFNLQNKINNLITEKVKKSSLFNSIVNELLNYIKSNQVILDKPKYRIRGFFEIPKPKYNDKTGYQEVIQFEIAYRYLRFSDEKPVNAEEFTFQTSDGQEIKGYFSPWVYYKSDVRKKYFDYELGIYKWEEEDIINPDLPNINQVDIPISPGEKVEIKVRSYSEAGYPLNPLISDWSPSIIIDFPEELINKNDEISFILEQLSVEENVIKFEEILNNKNLDFHLKNSVKYGDYYFSHSSDEIISGWYDLTGAPKNLKQKIEELENKIKELEGKILIKKGKLRVYLQDPQSGEIININNNSVVEVFAGYYLDYINSLPPSERKGAIITKIYNLILENETNGTLELISPYPGGIEERLKEIPTLQSELNNDYFTKLRYWEVPINNLSLLPNETRNSGGIYASNSQSRQLLSQFIYLRKKNVGLINDLCDEPQGINYFSPDFTGSVQYPWIWNGRFNINTLSNTITPAGNGYLSNFCVHIDCPILKENNNTRWDFNISKILEYQLIIDNYNDDYRYFQNPLIVLDEYELPKLGYVSPAFFHSYYFNLDSSKEDSHKQLLFKDPWLYDQNTFKPKKASDLNIGTIINYNNQKLFYIDNLNYFPKKIGFYPHDRYLIGEETCGSYLFLAPAFFEQLLVNGTDYNSVKVLEFGESNKIVIPVVFQFRMTDYYGDTPESGRVGGFNEKVLNLTYGKKIGIDLYIKDETRFSFDLYIFAKYQRITSSEAIINIPMNISKDIKNKIKLSKKNL